MRYRLRTLLVFLILGPPILAGWVVVDRDPFQIFLVIGFIAYFLICIVIGSVLGRLVHALTKLF
jgi:hypothetical protein